jgi:hypothetical protein
MSVNFRDLAYKTIELNKKVSNRIYVAHCCSGFMHSEKICYMQTLHRLICELAQTLDPELYDYIKDFHFVSNDCGMGICEMVEGTYDPVLDMCKHTSKDALSYDVFYNYCDKNSERMYKKRGYTINRFLPIDESPMVEQSDVTKLTEYQKMLKYLRKYIYRG